MKLNKDKYISFIQEVASKTPYVNFSTLQVQDVDSSTTTISVVLSEDFYLSEEFSKFFLDNNEYILYDLSFPTRTGTLSVVTISEPVDVEFKIDRIETQDEEEE